MVPSVTSTAIPPLASATKPPPSWKSDPVSATPSIVSGRPVRKRSARPRPAPSSTARCRCGRVGGVGVRSARGWAAAGPASRRRYRGVAPGLLAPAWVPRRGSAAPGPARSTKSAALSSVSCHEPEGAAGQTLDARPGVRERRPAIPSRQVLVALPTRPRRSRWWHPGSESRRFRRSRPCRWHRSRRRSRRRDPPRWRRARVRPPGHSGAPTSHAARRLIVAPLAVT